MCLIIFSHQPGSNLPLALAANRDEYHARATAPSGYWQDHPQILAGRDLVAGGTWMGITRSGRFAAITNYRDPDAKPAAPRSRGELTLDFLSGNLSPADYLDSLAGREAEYSGYNLLLGSPGDLWYLSNTGPTQGRGPRQLSAGLYGLSNASLDTPWPKVTLGKQVMAEFLRKPQIGHGQLARSVSSTSLASAEDLRIQNLTADMDALLSAQFIYAGPYGTRATTTLWATAEGQVEWQEKSFNQQGEETGVINETFQIQEIDEV